MTTVTDVPPPRAASSMRPALVVAVSASAMAGLVHAAAARGHDGDRFLVWMFTLCAAAQIVWAIAAAARPSRSMLVAGVVINGGAVVVWALTRTVGIPFVGSLTEVESVGTQDLVAALFATASVAGAARMLARPVVRTAMAPVWAGALAIVALLATMPVLKADHTHAHGDDHVHAAGHARGEAGDEHAHGEGADDHAHDDGEHADGEHEDGEGGAEHAHADGAAAGDDHAHGTSATVLGDHAHDDTEGSGSHDHPAGSGGGGTSHPHPPTTGGGGTHPHPPTTDPDHPHPPDDPDDPSPTGPIISLDDPRVTTAQRTIAQGLIDTVRAQLTGKTVESIKAAGYQWIGDGGGGGYQHYVNWTYYFDNVELDPTRIESIVVQNNQIVSGMYILKPGKTMADVPPLAGALTTWHDHQNLCFEGTMLVGIATNGVCTRGTLTPTPPMLHVWLVAHPCGPFAGIETHGGGGCGAHDDH